jgi:hypothetical protein
MKIECEIDKEHAFKLNDILAFECEGTTQGDIIEETIDLYWKHYQDQLG